MAYQPPFNSRPASYAPPLFTPFSQSLPSHFNPALSAAFASNLFPFAQFNPFPIYQQNNYYNTNLTYPDPALSLRTKTNPLTQNSSSGAFPFLQAKLMPQQARPLPARNNVIEISDDDEQPQAKPIVAVIKEKPIAGLGLQTGARHQLPPQKRQKQVIERGRVIEIKDTNENQLRRQARTAKKNVKLESTKEIPATPKCKKINKERYSYKFSEKQENLMKLLQYREYRPDLIMTGPRFQSKIPNSLLLSQVKQEWLAKLRESLLLRRQRQQ